jgi:uncharacterized protein
MLMILAGGWLLLIHMLLLASGDPVVRHFRYAPEQWPTAARPQRLVLLTDIHVSGPDMPPARLMRIVEQINALQPDIVLLGGDFLSAKKLATKRYGIAAALRPLASLRARSAILAVLGNHDHWTGAEATGRELRRAGATVLDNQAVRIGNIVIGGVDDDFTDHADVQAVAGRLEGLGGVPLILSHSPDIFPTTPPSVGLVLAGHTHCGQISFPLIGPLFTASHHGKRLACGIIRDKHRTMIVSAGVGTSLLPLRLGAPPDIWVIEIGR